MIKNKLEGLMLSIIDDTRIEDFCFTDNFVIATIGIKDGPIYAPVLDYEITGDESLIIDKDSFNIEWKQVVFEGNTISVIRNNKPALYRVAPDKKR
ncbi:hypothetical protein [Pseudoalteromonas rhizosphaerae]|uniref:hypothetical protein n=1 Tax=Pseudoalteromonas rhizosphaerae TaxID=2518973 RepID=UPI0012315DDE|nr:hypothetical protein [Pseudoalteromonas rhizosphaerae]